MKRKRRTKKRASEPGKAPTLKAQQQKARKLQQLVDDLERGENFNITRLVVIKSLCQDVKTAARFTLHLARLAQERWRVLLVEKAIYCALTEDETAARHWAYQAARDYAEKYDPH